MSKITSIISCKGGVGKTTSAVNISSYIHTQGKRVLAVDLDYQHNLKALFRKPIKPQISSVTISGDSLKEYADILPDSKEVERLFLEFLKAYRCSVTQA